MHVAVGAVADLSDFLVITIVKESERYKQKLSLYLQARIHKLYLANKEFCTHLS